jgi:hypothetical protein
MRAYRGFVLLAFTAACGGRSGQSLPPPPASDAGASADAAPAPAEADATIGADSDAGGSPADGGTNPPPPTGPTIDLTLEPFDVPSGTERQVCKRVNVPSTVPFDVVRFHSSMGTNSHHLNVYKVLGNTQPVSAADGMVHDCAPGAEQLNGNAAYIYGSAVPERTVETPDNVAFRLLAGQQLIIEQHIINATLQTSMGGATFSITAATSSVAHYADIVWMGYWGIYLPAGQTTSFSASCAMPYDLTVFGLSSHTHALGVDFTISGPMGMLYENTDWSHPLYKTFTPVFSMPRGSNFSWTCTWDNTTQHPVSAGRNSTDEMCIAFAYAYPTRTASAAPYQCNLPFTP